MSYTYPISSAAMFEDRFDQFVTLGLPRSDVQNMRDSINDMWADGPSGWVHEWSRLALRYSGNGQDYLASLAYGCAKFPCLANDARRIALGKQLESYLAASSTFPVKFERRLIDVPFGATTATIPVHLYSTTGEYQRAPVILLNGGVDTWKMDVHGLCVALAQRSSATVASFDQPGTGETPVPLTIEADEIVLGLVKETRNLGNGKVAHFATSFGANYSAMTGLFGVVDYAIVIGAPIDSAFAVDALRKLPYGMPDIIGNDMGFDRRPSEAEFVEGLKKFSRGALLDRASNAPMLVINGADDYFIPQADTRIFEGRPNTEVHLMEGTGHCAFSKLPEVMATVFRWLPQQLESAPNS
jgi:esterase FrsA